MYYVKAEKHGDTQTRFLHGAPLHGVAQTGHPLAIDQSADLSRQSCGYLAEIVLIGIAPEHIEAYLLHLLLKRHAREKILNTILQRCRRVLIYRHIVRLNFISGGREKRKAKCNG